jgi:hypothetical protein
MFLELPGKRIEYDDCEAPRGFPDRNPDGPDQLN